MDLINVYQRYAVKQKHGGSKKFLRIQHVIEILLKICKDEADSTLFKIISLSVVKSHFQHRSKHYWPRCRDESVFLAGECGWKTLKIFDQISITPF